MDRAELTRLLELDDFSPIYRRADEVRRREVGDEVKIRAILEFSNHCRRRCAYCGLNAGNPKLPRYRMTPEEMVEVARIHKDVLSRYGMDTRTCKTMCLECGCCDLVPFRDL